MPFQTLAQHRATSEASPTMPYITRAWYNKVFLSIAEPALVHDQFGMPATLPKKTGEQVVWRRWNKLAVNTVPLSDGITPTGKTLVYENVIGTVYWYGDWVGITDVVDFMHPDNVLTIATKRLALQAAETADTLTRDIINAGTGYLACLTSSSSGVGARVTVAIEITAHALKTAITELEGNDAKYFVGKMGASTKVATEPIGPSYIGIVHPHVVHDLPALGSEWIPREKYASGNVAYPTEVGKFRNVRFVSSSLAKVWASEGAAGTSGPTAASVFRSSHVTPNTAADVYSVLILGKEAYGVVKLAGSAATYYNAAGGNSDPIHQRSTAGWKMARGATILNDTYMKRIECLAKW